MAVEFKVEHKRTTEYRFYPEDITINPRLNGRHNKPDIEPLIEDILRQGQHTPVTIRNDGGRPVLVTGFSRWCAVSEINKRKLADVKMQLRCTYVQCTEAQGFLANISENRFRNSTTPVDDAYNIQRLIKNFAMTEEQAAAVYFPLAKTDEELKSAVRFIKNRLALISLAPEAEEAFRRGQMKESAAMAIARLSQEQQKHVIKTAEGKKIKGKDIKGPAKPRVDAPPSYLDIRAELSRVVNTGKYRGIGDKEIDAGEDMVEWAARLLGDKQREIKA